MALDTYAGLQASVGDFMLRSDLTAVIPDFIRLAETQINRRLRVADMMTSATLSITASATSTALPSDFNGVVSLELPSGIGGPLRYEKPEGVRAMRQTNYMTPGIPFAFTVIGANIETVPAPSSTLACLLVYFQRIPVLSVSNTSNWLLTKHPDIYLYGALLQSAPYLKDDERLAVWGQLYETALKDLEGSDSRTSFTHGLVAPFRGAAAPQGTGPLPAPMPAPGA